MLFFGAGPLEASTTARTLGWEAPDKASMLGWGSHERVIAMLTSALEHHTWLAGDRFTAADVYTGSQIYWGRQFGSIDPHPLLDDYVERLKARPAWQRATALDDALIGTNVR